MTTRRRTNGRSIAVKVAISLLLVSSGKVAFSQLISAPRTEGFNTTSSITTTVDEMLGPYKERKVGEPILGPGYPDLWIAEVQWKSLRHRLMEVVDPRTGEKNMELVWYLVYRVIQRDCTELAGDSRDALLKKLSDPDVQPQNTLDGAEGYPLQLPRFVLRTDDSADRKEYIDEVNIEVQRAVFAREFQGRAADVRLLSSVDGITEVLEPVSVNDPDPLSQAAYGVAIWRGVDPKTDYFTITMSGFSNAYRYMTDPTTGEGVFQHKVIEQRFGRPGDEFRQEESEFRQINGARLDKNGSVVVDMEGVLARFRIGQPSPAFVADLRAGFEERLAAGRRPERSWPIWSYQNRPARVTANDFETVLRNLRTRGAETVDAGN